LSFEVESEDSGCVVGNVGALKEDYGGGVGSCVRKFLGYDCLGLG
jgi:hypothetical protein